MFMFSPSILGNPEVTVLLACQVFILKICFTCFPMKRNILLGNIFNCFTLKVSALSVENINKVCISIYLSICLW